MPPVNIEGRREDNPDPVEVGFPRCGRTSVSTSPSMFVLWRAHLLAGFSSCRGNTQPWRVHLGATQEDWRPAREPTPPPTRIKRASSGELDGGRLSAATRGVRTGCRKGGHGQQLDVSVPERRKTEREGPRQAGERKFLSYLSKVNIIYIMRQRCRQVGNGEFPCPGRPSSDGLH